MDALNDVIRRLREEKALLVEALQACDRYLPVYSEAEIIARAALAACGESKVGADHE